jgi:hypothetical protein
MLCYVIIIDSWERIEVGEGKERNGGVVPALALGLTWVHRELVTYAGKEGPIAATMVVISFPYCPSPK